MTFLLLGILWVPPYVKVYLSSPPSVTERLRTGSRALRPQTAPVLTTPGGRHDRGQVPTAPDTFVAGTGIFD